MEFNALKMHSEELDLGKMKVNDPCLMEDAAFSDNSKDAEVIQDAISVRIERKIDLISR